jgi:hypothetical protein
MEKITDPKMLELGFTRMKTYTDCYGYEVTAYYSKGRKYILKHSKSV